MRDRIVLIGRTASSLNDDKFSTPYSWNLNTTPIQIPGVELHAQIASQIVNSALNNRPLIKTLNEPLELLWIVSWSVLITILARKWWHTSDSKNFATKFFLNLITSSLAAAVAVVTIGYLAFLWGWWIPVVPSFLALTISPLLIATYTYISKLNERQRSLEVMVGERTQQLQLNNQQLKQSMQQLEDAHQEILRISKLASMGSLMASVGHEIRNPLNFISIRAKDDVKLTKHLKLEIEQEYEYLPPEIAEDFKETLSGLITNAEDIKYQAKRIELILQLMIGSKEYIKTPPRLTNINELLLLINNLVFYGLQYEDHDFNVSLKTDYDDSIEQINLRELDISRALTNILTNACQAAYERSLSEQNLKPEVLVKSKNLVESDAVEISIQDNGTGIPQNILDKIFNPFFTTKPQGQGTGIGLYFAHDLIVDKNGGQIKVDSKLGAYTTFTVILPKKVV